MILIAVVKFSHLQFIKQNDIFEQKIYFLCRFLYDTKNIVIWSVRILVAEEILSLYNSLTFLTSTYEF